MRIWPLTSSSILVLEKLLGQMCGYFALLSVLSMICTCILTCIVYFCTKINLGDQIGLLKKLKRCDRWSTVILPVDWQVTRCHAALWWK